MKKYLLILKFSFLLIPFSFSQPAVEWENEMGTSGTDYAQSVAACPDGGYLVLGFRSGYFDGDATCFIEKTDVWLLKYDAEGELLWQRCYGGSFIDEGFSIIPVDGGYMIAAGSSSDDGDLTAHYGSHGVEDVWLFKINEDGDILWQKNYGGNSNDFPKQIIQTADGGFIIAANSNSNNHDVSGFHGGYSYDYWIFKINAAGTMQWQKCLGGTDEEQIGAIVQLSTGEYIVGGYSKSLDGDVTGMHGTVTNDIWIVKLSAAGAMLWQKCYGGNSDEQCQSMALTDEGNILIAGKTSSDDGDVVGFHGYYDAWLLKIDDDGNLLNQVCLGDVNGEYLSAIRITTENQFILTGERQPTIGGTPGCFGSCDFWALKTDEDLNVLWEECIGTADCETGRAVVQSNDGYLTVGDRYDDIDGGAGQICMYKIADDCVPEICNAIDDDCNGVIDEGIIETITIAAGGPTTFCQGGSVLLTATYSGVSVQWKKDGVNIPGATASTYNVTKKATYTCVTTSPCGTATSTGIYVNVQKNPPASITAGGATTFCAGGSVTLTEAASPGCSYQWYKGASLIAGATSINYVATIAGNYKCRVTKTTTGCFKNSNVIVVTVPCKESEISEENNSFSIYPNPATKSFTISADLNNNSSSTIEIFNNLGQLIYSKEIVEVDGIINETIEINNISSGIYLVKLSAASSVINADILLEKKLIIE